nr:THAP domain-containing protein 2-like [Hydra vulgaris]
MSGENSVKRGSQCCAFGCNKRKYGGGKRSDSDGPSDEESSLKRKFPRTFHKFPSNTEKRKEWINRIHRQEWSPGVSSLICSDHFLEKDIDRTGQTVRLRQNSLPKRFKNFPDHLKKTTKERKSPTERCISNSEISDSETSILPICMKFSSPIKTCNSILTPEKLLTDRRIKIIQSLKKKVKAEQQKSRRMKKCITSLKSVIKILHQKHKISSNCEEMLSKTVPLAVARRMIKGKNNNKGCQYSEEIKSFALTLQFYSSKVSSNIQVKSRPP